MAGRPATWKFQLSSVDSLNCALKTPPIIVGANPLGCDERRGALSRTDLRYVPHIPSISTVISMGLTLQWMLGFVPHVARTGDVQCRFMLLPSLTNQGKLMYHVSRRSRDTFPNCHRCVRLQRRQMPGVTRHGELRRLAEWSCGLHGVETFEFEVACKHHRIVARPRPCVV